jgi:hypothetical protein
MQVRTSAWVKFTVLPFRVKIQGQLLIYCVWPCSNNLVKDTVLTAMTIFRVKPKSFDRATTGLWTVTFGGVVFGEAEVHLLS